MKRVILGLKGVLFGVANVIPGVSGGTIALITGVFDKLMESIGGFFKKGIGKKKRLEYFWFLVVFGIGVGLGILGFAKLMAFLVDHHYQQPLYFLFAGLIGGSIPFILNLKPKMNPTAAKVLIMVAGIALVLGLTYISSVRNDSTNRSPLYETRTETIEGRSLHMEENAGQPETKMVEVRVPAKPGYLVWLLFCGFVGSIAMIMPGFSGSALMVALGEYTNIMKYIVKMDLLPLAVFAAGICLGILLAAKAITWLLEKYPPQTMYFILGLVIASLVQIGIEVVGSFDASAVKLIISIVAFPAGFVGAYMLGRVNPETLKAKRSKK